jgi:GTP cyclohydrolase IA
MSDGQIDRANLEAAVSALLEAVGEDPSRPDLLRTPERAAQMFEEIFGGLWIDPAMYLEETLPEEHQELVILRDITVSSMCEHHLVPMVGIAHLGYIPNGRIVGFERLAKVVDAFARRPQLQERLTREIADLIDEMLHPRGVAVHLELEHMCMTIRGIRQPWSQVVTTAYRGAFRDDPSLRVEFNTTIASG